MIGTCTACGRVKTKLYRVNAEAQLCPICDGRRDRDGFEARWTGVLHAAVVRSLAVDLRLEVDSPAKIEAE